jgi:AcrR family transcriptional regulator
MVARPGGVARRGRPRSAQAHAAVIEAATELLLSGGLRAATVDAISARSGVSKATIYKHWPNRTAVAIDVLAERMAREVPLPDTGSARGDLAEQVRRVSAFYATPVGALYAQLLAQTVVDPEAGELLRQRFLDSRREAIRVLWRRALERGEVRVDVDVEVATDILFGAIIFRLVSGHQALTPERADQIADAALHGLLR